MFRRVGLAVLALFVLSTGSVSAETVKVRMVGTGFSPINKTVPLGYALKFKNTTAKRHTAVPSVNWSFGGVDVAAGAAVTVYPSQAGTFRYLCTLHPSHQGTIRVPMSVTPLGGTTSTDFVFTLGTVNAPGVLVHQVEARLGTGAWVLRATTANATWALRFTTPGTYEVRTRMRYQLSGQVSEYSPSTTIVVF
jgi:plastocyanin